MHIRTYLSHIIADRKNCDDYILIINFNRVNSAKKCNAAVKITNEGKYSPSGFSIPICEYFSRNEETHNGCAPGCGGPEACENEGHRLLPPER